MSVSTVIGAEPSSAASGYGAVPTLTLVWNCSRAIRNGRAKPSWMRRGTAEAMSAAVPLPTDSAGLVPWGDHSIALSCRPGSVVAWVEPVGESHQRFGDRLTSHGGSSSSHPHKLARLADRHRRPASSSG
jgi:hypothetical protein